MIDNLEMMSSRGASRPVAFLENHSLVLISAPTKDEIKLLYIANDLHKMVKSKRNFLS